MSLWLCVLIHSCRAAHEITQIKLKVNANNEAFRVNLCQFYTRERLCLVMGHLEEVQRDVVFGLNPPAVTCGQSTRFAETSQADMSVQSKGCLFMQRYLAANVTVGQWHFCLY